MNAALHFFYFLFFLFVLCMLIYSETNLLEDAEGIITVSGGGFRRRNCHLGRFETYFQFFVEENGEN